MKQTKNATYGFTLVELAIVLMIIGLLIGGILRGQELMHNTRITTTIQQVKAYEGALVTFHDAYSALPGDILTADTRLPGCQTGNANSCIKGNGDGIIGLVDAVQATQFANSLPQAETVQFWKHLALAHLITGVQPNAVTTFDSGMVWGKTHPVAKIRGGFNVLYLSGNNLSGIKFPSGHFLRLQTPIVGNSAYADTSGCSSGPCQSLEAVSGKEGWQIDSKMDDGFPDHGSVLADDRGAGASNCEGQYNRTAEDFLCIMYFRLY